MATATSATETDTIAYTEWSAPVVLAKNGADGDNGTDGLNSATVFLYKRAASTPSKPTKNIVYTFATGAITDAEAKKRRDKIQEEANFFGSMDGAVKYVKGDATAGLVITVVNVVGGIAMGVLRQNLEFSAALNKYVILTILRNTYS